MRFAPCGRSYKRQAGPFAKSNSELCREPRFCQHCEKILELQTELAKFRHPMVEVTVPADAFDTDGLGKQEPGRVEVFAPTGIIDIPTDDD